MVDMVHRLQDTICDAISELDGSNYREDEWVREEGGGGRSRVFSEGTLFEKAGVNVSVVQGTLRPEAALKMGGGHTLEGTDLSFFATGVEPGSSPTQSNGTNRSCELPLLRARRWPSRGKLVVRWRSRFDTILPI